MGTGNVYPGLLTVFGRKTTSHWELVYRESNLTSNSLYCCQLPSKAIQHQTHSIQYLHRLALLLEQQLLPVPLGLVQGILNGQLPILHLVHEDQLHLIAQLKRGNQSLRDHNCYVLERGPLIRYVICWEESLSCAMHLKMLLLFLEHLCLVSSWLTSSLSSRQQGFNSQYVSVQYSEECHTLNMLQRFVVIRISNLPLNNQAIKLRLRLGRQ